MRRTFAWKYLLLAIAALMLFFACDSETEEKEDIISSVSYTVSIGDSEYTLSTDLSTLTGTDGSSYAVSDLEVTIDGVGYTLSSEEDGTYTATAKDVGSEEEETSSQDDDDDDDVVLSFTESVTYSGSLGDLVYSSSYELSGYTVKASSDGTVTAVSDDGVTYTLTLSDEESSYTTECVYSGVLGDLVYTESIDTKGTVSSSYELDGYTIDEDAMTAESSDGVVYTLTLSGNEYSYSLTYKAASGSYNLGKIVVTDGLTALVKGETKTIADSTFEYTVTSSSTSTTYLVTLDESTLTYSTDEASYIVYSGILGDLAVTSSGSSSIAEFNTDYDLDADTYKVVDGEFTVIVTEGSVVTTYTIALGTDTYTAVTEEIVTTYEGDLGDIYVTEVFGSSSTDFEAESSSYVIEETDEDGVLTVTTSDGSITYTVTLSDDYTYEVDTDYEIATYDGDLGSVTVTTTKDGMTVVLGGDVYSLSSGEDSFTYTVEEDGKVTTYEVTVEDDGYSYEIVSTVETYTGTLGIITVTDGTSATIPGESGTYTVSKGTISYTVESSSATTVYTITLNSDYTYTLEAVSTVATYTGTFGTLTATTSSDGTVTAVFEDDDTEYTVDGSTFYLTVEEDSTVTVYTITLKTSTYNVTEYSYTTVYEGIFGDITISKVFGSTTATAYEISSNVYTVSASDNDFELTVSKNDGSASYQVTLDTSTGSYSYDGSVVNSVTFVASSSSVDFGEITVLYEDNTASETKVDGSPDGFTVNDDGTIAITSEEGSVTSDYTITLGDYDYTTSNGYYYYYTNCDKAVTVTEYTRSSYDLGTVTVTETVTYDSAGSLVSDTVTAAIGSEDSITVTDNVFTYTDDFEYTITLSGSTYTYTYTDTAAYTGALATLYETRDYTVATTSTYTSEYAMSGYTMSSDGTTATKNSIDYTLTLDSSAYTYSYTVDYTADSSAYDLGTYTVTVGSTGAIEEYSNSSSLSVYSGAFSLTATFKVESGAVIYTVGMDSSTCTYSTEKYQTTYTYGSGVSIGDIVVLESSQTATIDGSGSYTVSSYAITQQYTSSDEAILYNITLSSSAYTYSTAVYSTTYTANSGSVDLGSIVVYASTGEATIGGSGSYTVSSNVISEYLYSTYYEYNITLNDTSHVYVTSLYATLYLDSSSTGYGTIYVYSDNTALVNGTSGLSVSSSTIYYPASVSSGGVQYTITLSDSSHTYTRAVYQTVYIFSSGTDFGTVIVNSSNKVISINGTSLSSTISVSSNAFKYTSGAFTYTFTLTSSYTYTTALYSTTYTESGSSYGLGDIVVIASTGKATIGSGTTTYTVSSNKITYAYNSYTTYTITLNTTAYTYSASCKIVYTYTNSYYGTITKTDVDGTATYTKATDSTYGSTLYSTAGEYISVGYVRFKITYGSVSNGTGTYTATELYWISSSLLKGYGEYTIKVYFFYVHSTDYYNYYSDYNRKFYIGIKGTEGSADVGIATNATGGKVLGTLTATAIDTACEAYFEPDGLTISCNVSSSDIQNIQVVFDPDNSQIATVYLDGYVQSTYVSTSSSSYTFPIKSSGNKVHDMSSDVIYIRTTSASGYSLKNSVPSKIVSSSSISTSTGDLYYKYSFTQASSDEKNYSSYISAIVEFDSGTYENCEDVGEM